MALSPSHSSAGTLTFMSNPLFRAAARVAAWPTRNPAMVQTLAAFSIKIAGAVLSFGLTLLVARLFGAAGTGFFALALTTATVLATISLTGFDYLLLRSVARELRLGRTAEVRGEVQTATRAVFVQSGIAAIGLGIFAFSPLPVMLGTKLDPLLLGLAALAVLPLAMGRIALGVLRGAGSPVIAQWMDGPFAMSITLFCVLVIAISGMPTSGAPTVFAIHVVAISLSVSFGWVLVRRTMRGWPTAIPISVRTLMSTSWRLSAITLSMMVTDWLLLLIINERASSAEVGQYRVAWQIVSVVAMVVATFETVAGPQIAAAYGVQDLVAIRRIYRQSVRVMLALSSPLFIVLFAVPELILGLFGPEFASAATPLRILAFGQLLNIATGPLGAVIIMTGHERWSLRMSGWSLLLIAVLGAVLIPRYGIIGAALTSSGNILFRNLFGGYIVRNIIFGAKAKA